MGRMGALGGSGGRVGSGSCSGWRGAGTGRTRSTGGVPACESSASGGVGGGEQGTDDALALAQGVQGEPDRPRDVMAKPTGVGRRGEIKWA